MEISSSSARKVFVARHADAQQSCFICMDTEGSDLITPCNCKDQGLPKKVHRSCLDTWRVTGANARAFTHCPNCAAAYVLKLQRAPTETERQLNERRRRFLETIVSHFFLTTISIQTGLILLAMLIRAIDQKEAIVSFFNLWQLEDAPPIGEGDFLDALKYRKSSYYLAAVLVSLFLLGLFYVVRLCVSSPTSGRNDGLADPCPGSSCSGDCCFLCYHVDVPACECPCASPSSALGDCSQGCCGCSCASDSCGECVAVVFVVIVVAFILAGAFIFFIMVVTWLQKAVQRYFQIRELRHLTGEYIVQDLSELPLLPMLKASAPPQHLVEVPEATAPPPQDLEMGSPTPQLVWTTDPVTQESVVMDLQAVYGAATFRRSFH